MAEYEIYNGFKCLLFIAPKIETRFNQLLSTSVEKCLRFNSISSSGVVQSALQPVLPALRWWEQLNLAPKNKNQRTLHTDPEWIRTDGHFLKSTISCWLMQCTSETQDCDLLPQTEIRNKQRPRSRCHPMSQGEQQGDQPWLQKSDPLLLSPGPKQTPAHFVGNWKLGTFVFESLWDFCSVHLAQLLFGLWSHKQRAWMVSTFLPWPKMPVRHFVNTMPVFLFNAPGATEGASSWLPIHPNYQQLAHFMRGNSMPVCCLTLVRSLPGEQGDTRTGGDELQVFISYQWDAQSTVEQMDGIFHQEGIECWMDTSTAGVASARSHRSASQSSHHRQTGVNDLRVESLQLQIERNIRSATAVICCVTPKYLQCSNCIQDLTLAQSLQKPVIPVMLRFYPWPPEGAPLPVRKLLAQCTPVDLSSTKLFTQNMPSLINMIKRMPWMIQQKPAKNEKPSRKHGSPRPLGTIPKKLFSFLLCGIQRLWISAWARTMHSGPVLFLFLHTACQIDVANLQMCQKCHNKCSNNVMNLQKLF